MSAARFEMHEHHFITGPRALAGRSKFSHSHEGGSRGHKHPDCGPAALTIDQDEWARATGLRGGGRKTFTAKPTGEQMPYVERTKEESTFEVVIVGDGEPGLAVTGAAARMRLAFDMEQRTIRRGPGGGRKTAAR